ncbi:hypothetical protein ACHAPI_007876 [Fusarium lateritium]
MNLIMLLQALDDCERLLANGLSLDETLLDIDSALESLVSLCLAIRRTGRKSRLHKADRLFGPQEHAELKKHLECIIVLRPNAEGRETDGDFQQKIESLTLVQQHLVTSNLRRRNRFIQAQLHSLGLKRRVHGFELPLYEPVEESMEPVMTSQHQPPGNFDPVATGSPSQPNQHLPPTMSGTSASDPESKLEYKEPAPKEKDPDDEESATVVTQWLDGYEHETSDASPTLQLSKWDLDRLQIIAEQIASRQEDKLGLEICFADEHGDRSAAAETEVSKHSMEPFKTSHPEEPFEKGGEQLQEHEIPEKTSRWRFRGGADPLSIASTVVSIVSLTDRLNPIARKARKDLAKPPETSDTASILMALFEELKRADVALSIVKFRAFLENIQGETAPTSISLVQDYYDLEAFTNIMLKSSMDAIRPLPPQDLSKPITDYFIDSSHNTYLTGNQLNSRASASPYRHALLDGCRFIEIDVWNGDPAAPTNMSEGISKRTPEVVSTHQPSKTSSGMIQRATKRWSRVFNTDKTELSDKYDVPTQEPLSGPSSKVSFGEPIVTHGWTLTTPCGFRDVCTAIGESAFVNSDLPVIVSLEVHADLEQQEKMVEIMKEEWKGILLDSPLDGYDPAERLPRLEDLRNKILLPSLA